MRDRPQHGPGLRLRGVGSGANFKALNLSGAIPADFGERPGKVHVRAGGQCFDAVAEAFEEATLSGSMMVTIVESTRARICSPMNMASTRSLKVR